MRYPLSGPVKINFKARTCNDCDIQLSRPFIKAHDYNSLIAQCVYNYERTFVILLCWVGDILF